MKLSSAFTLLVPIAAVLLAGCSTEKHLVLAPVGPPPAVAGGGTEGSLVVFSATGRGAHFNSLPYHVFFSDYELHTDDGKLLQKVHNDSGSSINGPRRVVVRAGSYRVVARANGYGTITVPVVIRPGQTTTVHLEGGGWTSSSAVPSEPVRLPGGEIAGWSADARVTDSGVGGH